MTSLLIAAIVVAIIFAATSGVDGLPVNFPQADYGRNKGAKDRSYLETYVYTPDPVYGWSLHETTVASGYTAHMIMMTSLTWLEERYVDQPLWRHEVHIIVPDSVTNDVALTYIGTGYTNDTFWVERDFMIALAQATGSIVTMTRQIPNQWLCFVEPLPGTNDTDGGCLDEDFIRAYGQEQYFYKNYDPLWVMHLPMTKAAIRGMDTVSQFLQIDIQKWIVFGASKRGHASFLVGSIDSRVIGISPTVIDYANFVTMQNFVYRATGTGGGYGRLTGWINTPEYLQMTMLDDPFFYMVGLNNVAVLMQYAMKDLYFHEENARHYFAYLPTQTKIRYADFSHYDVYEQPGANDTVSNFAQWARHVIDGTMDLLPTFEFEHIRQAGQIVITTDPRYPPRNLSLYTADNTRTRSFDVATYQKTPIDPSSGNGVFTVTVPPPASGWRSYFVEAIFDPPAGQSVSVWNEEYNRLVWTTEIAITPDDYFPFGPCPDSVCKCGSPAECDSQMHA